MFLFSGQGSQYPGMGSGLFHRGGEFKNLMLRFDEVVRDLTGSSVVEAIYATRPAPVTALDRTLLTHPAIFMVECALALSLMADGVMPDVVLGTSMGTFAAAVIAGFLDAQAALEVVIGQAVALEAHCEPGGMLAILANSSLFLEEFLSASSEMAAVNFSSHFVVSAPSAALVPIETELRRRNIGHQRLPVSFAFHSRWIDEAETPFEQCLRSIRYRTPRLPFACCDSTGVLSQLRADYFWRATRRPIRLGETVARLELDGAHCYIDVGPGGTLATVLKYLIAQDSQSSAHPVMTPFGRETLNYTAVVGSMH